VINGVAPEPMLTRVLDPFIVARHCGTFTEFVGHPPMQYLSDWRMQLAANHLLAGTDSVAEIA
jgi:methylphosphotriester-DNA--protein-cysteine methyltransferase